MPNFTTNELEQLRDDIGNQVAVNGATAASSVVPRGMLRRKVRDIAEGNTRQTNSGLAGMGLGAISSGGLGALTMGLAKGKRHAPLGLLAAIPGAAVGYRSGKEREQQRQLYSLLEEELGEPKVASARWRKEMEPGFIQILDELKASKKENNLTDRGVKSAINDLRAGRKMPLTNDEKKMLQSHLGSKYYKPKVPLKGKGSFKGFERRVRTIQKNKDKTSKVPRTSRATKTLWSAIKKNKKPLAIMGGIAALGALGLSASTLAKKPSWEKR